jgi:hypothetical protein
LIISQSSKNKSATINQINMPFKADKYDTKDMITPEQMKNATRRSNVIKMNDEYMTMREYGGYNIVSDDYYKMMIGKVEAPRNCFYTNLELARKRNNKNDRLIVACMMRDCGTPLHHCFILNGKNIIDHSNLRKKNLPVELYFTVHKILRYAAIPYNSPDVCGTMIGLTARELEKGTIGYTDLQYKNGDWDDAVKKVL